MEKNYFLKIARPLVKYFTLLCLVSVITTVFGQQDSVIADFHAEDGCLGRTVQFNDSSTASGTNMIIAWDWDFGDGGTSAAQNPQHVYTSEGNFTVKLVITDDMQNKDSIEKAIDIFAVPTADFTSSVNNLDVDFTNDSQDGDTWFWDFGDGNTSTDENPSHTYAEIDSFTVCLIATNTEGCTDTACKEINLASVLNADFSADNACINEPVQFNDSSSTSASNEIVEWSWSFGDNNVSDVQNPIHTYTSSGNYTVKLVITDDMQNKDSIEKIITIHPLPIASFSYMVDGLDVEFTNNSIGESGWSWDFGDTLTSTDENPSHTYASEDDFTVCLTVTNANGCEDVMCKTISWNTSTLVADFFANDTCVGTPLNFIDISTADNSTITDWEWTFGDGTTSSSQNPQHTYATFGYYNVKLVVTNNEQNKDSVEKTVTIHTVPNTDYTFSNNNSLTVQFINNTSGAGAYFWWFGSDSHISTLPEPTFTFPANGIYEVCLSGYNISGCEDKVCKLIDLSTVGIVAANSDKGLKIFPNPAKDRITLSGNSLSKNGVAIKIINAQGKVIYSDLNKAEGDFIKEIPLFNVSSGLYFIEIQNDNIATHHKLIIQ